MSVRTVAGMASAEPVVTTRSGSVRQRCRRLHGNHMVRGSLAMIVGSVAAAAAGYVYWTFLARRYGAEEIGQISALGAIAAVVSLLNSQSFGAGILARFPALAAGEKRAIIRATTILVGALAACGALLGAVLFNVTTAGAVTRSPLVLIVFVVGVAAQSIGSTLDMVAVALRSARLSAWRNGVTSLLRLPVIVLVALLVGSLGGAESAVVTSSLTSVLSVAWLHRAVSSLLEASHERVPSRAVLGELRRGVGAQTLIAVGTGLPAQVLPAVVVAIAGAGAGGQFSMAWLVGSTCFMVPPMVCSTLIAEASREPSAMRVRMVQAFALTAALLAVPVTAYVLAGDRILEVFGSEFAAGGHPVLVALALSALPNTFVNVAVSALRVREELRSAARASMLGGVVALVSAVALLPVLGALGAGVGWLSGQTVGAVSAARAFRSVTSSVSV